MPSKVEKSHDGVNYAFSTLVEPSTELRYVDLHPDRPTTIISVVCFESDQSTGVYEVDDSEYLDTNEPGEEAEYYCVALLRQGDPYYEREILSQNGEPMKMRVSHERENPLVDLPSTSIDK